MLTCMVIDDEPLAIKLLEGHINKVSFIELQASFSDPLKALAALNNTTVDLIFLDIQMPQLNGIQFMQVLQNKAQVIITSAYQEYAIDGFDYNVTDYLLKPLSFERFYKAAEKAYRIKFPLMEKPKPLIDFYPATGGYVFIKVETKIVRVELDDIYYIEGLKNYVSIYTKQQRIVTLQVLRQLEEMLPANRFVRIHKSYIIALDKIVTIEKQQALIKEKLIPIGNTYVEKFYEMLEGLKK